MCSRARNNRPASAHGCDFIPRAGFRSAMQRKDLSDPVRQFAAAILSGAICAAHGARPAKIP
jgi:hypothetical protein